ncbi:response regulator transcription factor [Bordetella sp. H567]|uniref:response regulator transcription factor n=1 Tax=Bordetella sp. H567 TaxID=1697043 RepID=UPI000ABFC83A
MESCNATENTPLSLALWEPDDDTRNRTVHLLARLGFHVHGCRDAAGLFQWLDLRDPDLVLVGASAPVGQVVEAVLPRLSAHYGAGILLQAPDAAQQTRLSALQAGAHLCLDRRYEATELAALLRAQARRAGRQRRRTAGAAIAGAASLAPAATPAALAAAGGHGAVARMGAAGASGAGSSGPSGAAAAAGAARPAGAAGATAATIPSARPPAPPNAVGLVGSTEIAGLLGAAPGARTAGYALRSLAMQAAGTPGGDGVARLMPAREPWRILYQGWVLITPAGKRIHLTGTERACFICLLESPKRELSRAAMSEFMTATNLRSVNVAISRLRKKVHESGERLPLHTVHGMGYVFVGDLATEE